MADLTERLNEPAFYRGDAAEIARVHAELSGLQAQIDSAYARWEALESMRSAAG
jgi:ATP-binding cassette subfamily F protein uup